MPREKATPEQVSAARRAAAKVFWDSMTPEQRTAKAKGIWAGYTAKQRSAIARKRFKAVRDRKLAAMRPEGQDSQET